jgi:hypothetical protein
MSDFNPTPASATASTVTCVQNVELRSLTALLMRVGLQAIEVAINVDIPGSYWGECEAGLIDNRLYFRGDTPLHSVLHEACHFICMDAQRRAALNRDAGGDYDEENAVCYLQIVLADHLADVGRERMCNDMDAWGYTFRLGSAQAWFEQDAQDARQWLVHEGLITAQLQPVWRVRHQ